MALKATHWDFNKFRSIFFFALLIILGIAILYLFRPFFYPIFWAGILAVFFHPVYNWLLKYLRWNFLCAIISLFIIVALIILPLVAISTIIINQSLSLYQAVSNGSLLVQVKNLAGWLDNSSISPYLGVVRDYWNENIQNFTKTISIFLLNNLQNITQNSLQFLGMFLLMLYTLYYFLKDGPRILKRAMHLSPLGDKYETLLYRRFTSTVRATLKGMFIVGGIQAIIGGITFWLTGIQGALIWAILMLVATLVPAFGCSAVWLPAGIVMIVMGNVWPGIIILLVGFFVISTIDNVLRPIIVGKDIQMHPLLVLFSTLGGILIFGISGVIIGPVIASLFLAVIVIYEEHYRSQLENN